MWQVGAEMANIYHILGADIPHHNRTVLTFFQNELASEFVDKPHFYVVSSNDLAYDFPALTINTYRSQRALTQAIIAKYQADPTAWFVLHGQFNVSLWLAILFGRVSAKRCIWHIWGADLYEESRSLKFKLFYPLRRLAQRRIARIWATQGDLGYVNQRFDRTGFKDQLLYFPTKLPERVPERQKDRTLTILLGNSGDPSNRHPDGLALIKQQFGSDVRVLVPIGYPTNNQTYVDRVRKQAEHLFADGQVEILTDKLPFESYIELLSHCDLACFLFERQQGIGTICLLTQLKIPVILARHNPFCLDMEMAGVDFLYSDQLSLEKLQQVQQGLSQLDVSTVAFFPPNYIAQWKMALAQLKG